MVMLVIIVFACIMYVIEGPKNGFVSIPMSIYWAVVTITTVGYGDLVPQTPAGRFIASFGMLVGTQSSRSRLRSLRVNYGSASMSNASGIRRCRGTVPYAPNRDTASTHSSVDTAAPR